MSLLERIHGGYIHRRRIDVLSRHLADILPRNVSVLDVGCGDGTLSRRIQEMRKDTSIKGIDVLVRPDVEIEVSRFDGNAIPLDNRSVDVVMFVDVLHHTMDPMMLLREAVRVAATAIVIKDHLLEGFLAGPTLRLMDRVGNRRHGVALPYNYWNRQQWDRAWNELQLTVRAWRARLGLCPVPANLIFERCLHFLTLLEPRYKTR